MKLLNNLWVWYENLWTRPSVLESIALEMRKAQQDIRDAQRVIYDHRFQVHMSRATIAALEAWNHEEMQHDLK